MFPWVVGRTSAKADPLRERVRAYAADDRLSQAGEFEGATAPSISEVRVGRVGQIWGGGAPAAAAPLPAGCGAG